MIPTIIVLILISILIPLIFRTNEPVSEDNEKIVFEFNKTFKIVMLACTLIFVIVSIVFFIIAIYSDKKDELIAVVFFALFALLSSILYLLARNKKIIYINNTLYVYNIFGRQTSFHVEDIKEAIEIPSDGLKLIFKDNRKIKVDTQMANYSKIKEILDKHNIICRDKNGNKALKGW